MKLNKTYLLDSLPSISCKLFIQPGVQFRIAVLPLFIGLSVFFVSCENKSEYQKRVETELARNIRVDSLFLGYEFGMTSQDFFEHSWQMNKQEIITGQTDINYRLTDLKKPALMTFYPEFKNDRIYKLPIDVHYEGWAPWNRELFSDSLMTDLANFYENRYDAKFIKTIHPEHQTEALIDVQGNRQIALFTKNDRIVSIEFLDLSAIENNH